MKFATLPDNLRPGPLTRLYFLSKSGSLTTDFACATSSKHHGAPDKQAADYLTNEPPKKKSTKGKTCPHGSIPSTFDKEVQ